MAKQDDETVDTGADPEGPTGHKKQSAVKFLASRQGRPTLIWVAIAVVVSIAVVLWLSSVLMGPEQTRQERSQDRVASEGDSSVDARSDDEVSGDLTSENLTDEGREAADRYNEKADEDEDAHPTPTFNNVQMVSTQRESEGDGDSEDEGSQEDGEGEDEPSGLSGGGDEDTYSYDAPGSSDDEQQQDQTSEQGSDNGQQAGGGQRKMTRKEWEQNRKDRRKEANELMETYSEPPEIASKSFGDDQQDGQGQAGGSQEQAQRPSAAAQPQQASAAPAGAENADNGGSNGGSGGERGDDCGQPLVKGGDVVYANNDIALNTDMQGPVRVTFLQGELSGWRGMGEFELNELGAKMNITVDRVISPEGESFDVQGYVLDPETTQWAVSSDVDRHLIYRYGGFGLASILGGFQDLAEARATKSEQTTGDGGISKEYREPDSKQISWTLLGDFGEVWQEVFADNIDRPITVSLDPNERIGVMFEDTVCGPERDKDGMEAMREEGLSDPLSR